MLERTRHSVWRKPRPSPLLTALGRVLVRGVAVEESSSTRLAWRRSGGRGAWALAVSTTWQPEGRGEQPSVLLDYSLSDSVKQDKDYSLAFL